MLTLNVKIVKLSRMLSLPGWVYQKKFAFTKTWGYNINSPMFCVDLTFEWHEMPWYSLCSFFFFFRISVRKRCFDESGFRHCYGNFFESVILKVT